MSQRGKHVAGSLHGEPAYSAKFEFHSAHSTENVAFGLLRSRLAAGNDEESPRAAGEELPTRPLMSDWTPARIGSLPFAYGFGPSRTRGFSPDECAAYARLLSAQGAAAQQPTPENNAAVAAAAAHHLSVTTAAGGAAGAASLVKAQAKAEATAQAKAKAQAKAEAAREAKAEAVRPSQVKAAALKAQLAAAMEADALTPLVAAISAWDAATPAGVAALLAEDAPAAARAQAAERLDSLLAEAARREAEARALAAAAAAAEGSEGAAAMAALMDSVLRGFADGVRALHPAEMPPPELASETWLPPISSLGDVAPFASALLAWLAARRAEAKQSLDTLTTEAAERAAALDALERRAELAEQQRDSLQQTCDELQALLHSSQGEMGGELQAAQVAKLQVEQELREAALELEALKIQGEADRRLLEATQAQLAEIEARFADQAACLTALQQSMEDGGTAGAAQAQALMEALAEAEAARAAAEAAEEARAVAEAARVGAVAEAQVAAAETAVAVEAAAAAAVEAAAAMEAVEAAEAARAASEEAREAAEASAAAERERAAAEAERLTAEVVTLETKAVDLEAEVANLGAEVSRLASLVTQLEGEKRDLEGRLNADEAQAALSLELDAARAESRAILEQAAQAEAALQAARAQLEEQEARARAEFEAAAAAAAEAAAVAAAALAAQEEEIRRLEAIGGTERALQSALDEAAAALEARLAEVADMKERVEVNRKKAERIEQAMFEKEEEVEEAHKRNEKLEEKLYGISGKPSGKEASGLAKASSMLDKQLQKKQAMFANMASAIQDKERQVRRRTRYVGPQPHAHRVAASDA